MSDAYPPAELSNEFCSNQADTMRKVLVRHAWVHIVMSKLLRAAELFDISRLCIFGRLGMPVLTMSDGVVKLATS